MWCYTDWFIPFDESNGQTDRLTFGHGAQNQIAGMLCFYFGTAQFGDLRTGIGN